MESSYGMSRVHAKVINCWVHKDKMIASFPSKNSKAHFAFSGIPPMSTKNL